METKEQHVELSAGVNFSIPMGAITDYLLTLSAFECYSVMEITRINAREQVARNIYNQGV